MVLGRDVRDERRGQAERGVQHRIGEPAADLRQHERHDDADQHPAAGRAQEVEADVPTRSARPRRHAIAVRKQTSAVASFIRLSPSRIVTTRRGRPTRLAIAVAATASGGATTAPIANAAQNGSGSWPIDSATRPSSHQATTPTPRAVNATRPTDSRPMDRRCLEKSTRLVLIAAEYSSGGRNPTSTTSGVELDPRDERQVRRGDPDDDQQQRGRDPYPSRQRGDRRDDGDEGHDLDRDMHAHSVAV